MFVKLARECAEAGFPVLRFDYRGMGDSDGALRTFDRIDDDVKAAIDELAAARPELRRFVLFGLCDAASAALIYAAKDPRVTALALLNPWVRSTRTASRARLWYYYPKRLVDRAFWRKLASGNFRPGKATRELLTTVRTGLGARPVPASAEKTYASSDDFIDRMLRGLQQFDGPVQVALSDRDLTAQEFTDLCRNDSRWRRAVGRSGVLRVTLRGADHTLSHERVRRNYVDALCAWLANL